MNNAFIPIFPRIFLPGKGIGDINNDLIKIEKRINRLVMVNKYLISILENAPDSTIFIGLEKCNSSVQKDTLFFPQVLIASTQPEPLPIQIGPNLWDIINRPLFPKDSVEDPSIALNLLLDLFYQFVYENNRL